MTDTVFILDRNKNVIDYLSNNGANPIAPFFDDNYIPELSNGAETYEFSTISNAITSEMLQVGNYIVFIYDNKYKMFQIMDTKEEHDEGSILINCYCEIAGLELLTDYCEPFTIEGNVELFFNTVLQDTNWSLGRYSSSLVTNIQQVKVDKYTNVYKVIQENIATFGNIEIEYRVEFDGNRVLGYFIDVYANGERGNKTYKRFEYGENVKGIARKRNLYDFASAMIGVGKDGLTFKDIEWKKSKGDPADKPLGQDFIVDLEANEKFNKHGKYIKGLYENNDITNPQDLLLKTWERLQEVKEPKFDYEVDLAMTTTEYEDIKVGDTVYVIDNDYNPPIWVEARVGKPELSLSDGTANKCTLSNYKEIVSKIREPKDGEDGKTPEIGDNGNWVIGGIDTGKPSQGIQGNDGVGVASITEEYYLSSSKITQTGGSWVTSPPTWSLGKYMWTRSKIVYTGSTSAEYTTPICDSSWEAVNDIEIGARNIVLDTNTSKSITGTGTTNKTGCKYQLAIPYLTDIKDKELIVAFDWEYEGETPGGTFYMQTGEPQYGRITSNQTISENNTKGTVKSIWKPTSEKDTKYVFIRTDNITGLFTISKLRIYFGSKDLGWMHAPEDAIKGMDVMYYLSSSQTSLTGGSWSTTAPNWVNGKYMWSKTVITYNDGTTKESDPTCIAGAKGDKGETGPPGADGDSPYYITLDAQNFMKYIDKNTPPIPTVIPITAYIHEGSKDITSNCTFRWYYITSNYPDLATYDADEDTIVTLDGTDISVYDSVTTEWTEITGVTGNTLEIAYNSDIFFEKDIINIKVVATNNGDSISTEHTIYKVYDNKYITQQEIFDKLMENGNNFVYKDEETGLYYINASFIKAGQFVADLIKGGILTLGGTGDNSLGDYGYLRVLNYDGTEEVAHLDGGDLWIKSLSVESINAKEVNAENVNNASLPSKLDENINVYVNANTGSDDVEFVEGSVYSSLQSAIDSIPNYINGKDIRIYLQTSVYEDIEIRGISGGGVYIYLCSKTIFGNVNIKNNSARIGIYGGNSTSKPTTNGIIKPSSFLTRNSKGFSVVTQSSTYVILQYVDIYGSVSSSDKSYYTALYAYDNANTIFNGGKIIGSDNAFRTDTMGKIHVFESYGYVNNYVFRAANMSSIGIASATQCNGVNKVSQDATSSINYSSSGIKWDGSTASGKNDNTTTSSKSVTFKSNYGDTYRSSIYNSWKKDNTVRQGDYGYGDCNGCWFFGSQFANLKEKTITKVVLKIKRNSGGSGSSVNHVIKMHNHSSRPSGKPTYVSGWSKSVSIAAGETKTITITDSAVLSAIKSGTMKGFGIQSSYSKANYSVCSGNITAIVTYK